MDKEKIKYVLAEEEISIEEQIPYDLEIKPKVPIRSGQEFFIEDMQIEHEYLNITAVLVINEGVKVWLDWTLFKSKKVIICEDSI